MVFFWVFVEVVEVSCVLFEGEDDFGFGGFKGDFEWVFEG